MKILGIDTSALTASVALLDDERLLGTFSLNAALTHSETLLPMIELLLSSAGVAPGELGLIAVAAGPGSFTGVRIGISTAKGLAFANNTPCAPVSTLEALARNLNGFAAHSNSLIVPVMDARRSQLYNAVFRGTERLTPDRLISLSDLRDELSGYDADEILFVGDGYRIARVGITLPSVHNTPESALYQNAASVALSARSTPPTTAEALAPVYLRLSQAERERETRVGGTRLS